MCVALIFVFLAFSSVLSSALITLSFNSCVMFGYSYFLKQNTLTHTLEQPLSFITGWLFFFSSLQNTTWVLHVYHSSFFMDPFLFYVHINCEFSYGMVTLFVQKLTCPYIILHFSWYFNHYDCGVWAVNAKNKVEFGYVSRVCRII